MTVYLPTGRTVKLTFVHSSPNFETKPGATSLRLAIDADARRMGRRLTLCEISRLGFSGSTASDESSVSYATLGHGVAVCHPNDVFSKAAGRKVAVGHALVAAELDYDDRAAVWAAYNAEFSGVTVGQLLKQVGSAIEMLAASGEFEALDAIRLDAEAAFTAATKAFAAQV